MQWYYYSRERLINLHRLWSCHRLLVGHICSLISGAHIYYEHIMMCIKIIWFAWTSSQRYQSAIINQLGNIWERQRWWDDERNCGSTHTWYVHMYTTIPLQLMMTDEGALGREIQQSTIIISCTQDNVLYCLSHEVLSDCNGNTKRYITIKNISIS